MEDTVHPVAGAEQGFFISDIRLGPRRKKRVRRSGSKAQIPTVHLATSQNWSPERPQGQEGCGAGFVIAQGVTTVTHLPG